MGVSLRRGGGARARRVWKQVRRKNEAKLNDLEI